MNIEIHNTVKGNNVQKPANMFVLYISINTCTHSRPKIAKAHNIWIVPKTATADEKNLFLNRVLLVHR